MRGETAHSVGALLRTLRHSQRLSQEKTAEQAGVARLTLIRWERGTHQPRLPELMAVLDALQAAPGLREQALTLVSAPRAAYALREQEGFQIAGSDTDIPIPGVGDLLRTMRLRRQQTQEQLATKMGVRRHTLSRWEGGELLLSSERLDQLLTLLGAHPEERAALIQARLLPSLAANTADSSLDSLVERLQNVAHGAYNAALEPLKDLEYLRIEADLARMISRRPNAYRFLLTTYTCHAQWLGSNRRYREAETYVMQAMERGRNERLMPKEQLHTALVAAQAVSNSGRQPRPEHGIEMLHPWLPLAASYPEYEAWIYGNIALYLKQAGRIESALDFAARACRVARRCDNPTELRCRRVDQAEILLQTGETGDAMRALELLPTDRDDHPGERLREAGLWAEGLLWVGERADAQNWLERALAMAAEYNLDAAEVNALAQRF